MLRSIIHGINVVQWIRIKIDWQIQTMLGAMELALSLEQLSPSLLVLLSFIFIFVAVFLFGVIFILEIIFSLAVVFEFFCCLPLWWHLHFWDCLYFWGHFLWSSLHFLVVINVEATLIFEVIFIFMVQYNNNIKFWTEYKYK